MPTSASDQTVAVRAPEGPKNGAPLKVASRTFADGAMLQSEQVFQMCGGKNVSPQLSWSGAPQGTRSYAITCFDPDAPTGSGYWHWLAFNIPASVTNLDAGAGKDDSPAGGDSGYSDFGMNSYGGPCPPKGHGDHRYIFTVYALDVDKVAGASKKTTGATLIFSMRGHVLARGNITGRFGH